MQMSLDEAHLILNVKKEDPLEIIEKVSQVEASSRFPGEREEEERTVLTTRTSRLSSKQMDHPQNQSHPPNQHLQPPNQHQQHANRVNQNNLNIHITFSQKSTERWNV
jgi:hypothetical protein